MSFVTNATKIEIEIKKQGKESDFVDGRIINVRDRLVYHTNYECELAHSDYVIDGELIAPNSGVIIKNNKEFLEECLLCKDERSTICKTCEGWGFFADKCKRCGGEGYLEHYRHVKGGICFRCNGKGYEGKKYCKKCNGTGVRREVKYYDINGVRVCMNYHEKEAEKIINLSRKKVEENVMSVKPDYEVIRSYKRREVDELPLDRAMVRTGFQAAPLVGRGHTVTVVKKEGVWKVENVGEWIS